MKQKTKTYGIILGVVLFIALVAGLTYAYYKWTSTEDINVSVVVEGNTVTFVGGTNITGTLIPTATKEEGISKEVTVSASETGSVMSLFLDLTTMPADLKETTFEWEIYKNSETTPVNSGNFGVYNASTNAKGTTYATSGTTTITLLNGVDVNTTTDKYTLYLWFNGNTDNPSTMQNQTLSFDLYATGEGATIGQ